MIRTHNIDQKDALHLNTYPHSIVLPANDTDEYVTILTMSALSVGQRLTILNNGWCPGHPSCMSYTTATDTVTAVFVIRGINQHGKSVTERLVLNAVAAGTNAFTQNAFRRILEIQVESRTSNTATITFGIYSGGSGNGAKFALPQRINTFNTAGTSLPSAGPFLGELVGVLSAAGVWQSILAEDRQFGTIQMNAATTGHHILVYNLSNIGPRGD